MLADTAAAKVRDLNNVQICPSCWQIVMKIGPLEGKFYVE